MTNGEIENMDTQAEIKIENLAAKAIKAENFLEARRLLEPLVGSDSEYALTTLGWMHEVGKGAPRDGKVAASYYERATKLGCLDAFNPLGRVLWAEGELIKAQNTFKQGAELGNVGSMSWLGVMMLSGIGGPSDVENAMKWLNAAAEKGHIVAKGLLLSLERQNSKSIFRHIIYHFKRAVLVMSGIKDYISNPYSGKLF